MGDRIYYRENYKYQLSRPYSLFTAIYPPHEIRHEFFTFGTDGVLSIRSGYAWDGASGPTWDTKSCMRASLVHDCLCQAMKLRELDYETYSAQVHQLFHDICVEDNMFKLRAMIWHLGVVVGRGGDPSLPADDVEVTAP